MGGEKIMENLTETPWGKFTIGDDFFEVKYAGREIVKIYKNGQLMKKCNSLYQLYSAMEKIVKTMEKKPEDQDKERKEKRDVCCLH
jgi:hypothetical protein